MPRFFVPAEDIADDRASLRGTEFRHLQRVLRLREGDEVTLFDDAGQEHAGVIVSLSPRVAVVRITATATPERESPLALTLCQGVPKGRKMDLVVEKATELGVRTIVPFVSAFGAGAAAGATGKGERWRRIAVAAAKQCGRTAVPEIVDVLMFPQMIASAQRSDLRLLFFEGASAAPFAAVEESPHPGFPAAAARDRGITAAVIVGPEGGLSRDEVASAGAAGFRVVGLGPRILRTETAALVAVALVQARWGDLGNAR